MKKLFMVILALALASPAVAQVHVKGYVKSNGTYVAPYVRTSPDRSIYNNYSTTPNVNPYTGKTGSVNPYAPSTLYTAPKPLPPPCYYNCPR